MTTRQTDTATPPLLSDLAIRETRPEDAPPLTRLTARNFQPFLTAGSEGPDHCHLAAFLDQVPVGLLISRRDPERAERQEILSLMVAPLLRRQGIAGALLAALEERLPARGITEMAASWSDRLPQIDSFGGLLARHGWEPPRPQRLRMSFNVRDAIEALQGTRQLMARALGRGTVYLPLSALGKEGWPKLAAAAAAYEKRGLLPGWADPRPWEETSDPHVSQLLMGSDGAIRGWLLAEHQPAFNRHAAPVGWAGGDAEAMLLAAKGWLNALEQREGPGATLILQPTYKNGARVASLLDRHFRPHALWSDQLVISVRPVSAAGSSIARRGRSM